MEVIFLGTILICFIVYLFNQIYNKYLRITPKFVTVSLHTNRSALLTKQRKVVKERRRQITGKSAADNTGQIVPPENENTYPESADPMDAGFGDDLGLAIEQVQEESAITLVKRRSRFADMISAAEELKDIYKRNSKLE